MQKQSIFITINQFAAELKMTHTSLKRGWMTVVI